jgi:hypothetical protein
MLASANMLAPKSPVMSCLGDSKPLYCKQISAVRFSVHEMQLLEIPHAESLCAVERSNSDLENFMSAAR